MRNLDQELIAGMVAVLVVDVLEAIEVVEERNEFSIAWVALRQRVSVGTAPEKNVRVLAMMMPAAMARAEERNLAEQHEADGIVVIGTAGMLIEDAVVRARGSALRRASLCASGYHGLLSAISSGL